MYRLFSIDGLTNPTKSVADFESRWHLVSNVSSGVTGAARSTAVWVGIACLLVSFAVACNTGTATPASTLDVVVEVTAASSTPTAVVPDAASPPAVATLRSGIATATVGAVFEPSVAPPTATPQAVVPDPTAPPAVATLRSGIATATPESFVEDTEPEVQESSSDRPAVFRYNVGSGQLLIPDPVIDHVSNGFLFHEVYSGLMRPSPTGLDQVEPDLVTGYRVSPDGLVYTFTLREGLRFSDGSPLTAHQVKWSWERALNPDVRSERATEVLGAIKGAGAIAEGEETELTGFLIVDETTFEVELKRPVSHFPWLLSDPVASVMLPSNARRWAAPAIDWGGGQSIPSFLEPPIGTGPYRVARLDPIERDVVLELNPHYWDSAPDLGAVEYANFTPGVDDPAGMWLAGAWDNAVGPLSGCFAFERGDTVTWDGIEAVLTRSDTAPQVSYLAFNTAVPPFDDVALRRALVASADIVSFEFERNSDQPGIPAAGLLPPNFPGHRGSAAVEGPDVVASLEEFAASKYGDSVKGFSVRMIPFSIWPVRADFEQMTANWRDSLGLDVGFTDLPIPAWQPEVRRRLEAGTLQMRYVLTRPGYPSPHAILGPIPSLFGPNAQSPETEGLQRMLDDAAAELDAVVRLGMYQDIEAHILDRALVLPMLWDSGGRCNRVQEWVTEFSVPKWGGSVFRNVVIDTEHPDYPDRWLETDP